MTSLENLKRKIGECHENQTTQQKDDVLMISESIEKFSKDLYKIVACDKEGNFSISGLSAYFALSMCSLGAKENTAREMQKALYLENSSQLTNIEDVISYLNGRNIVECINRIYVNEIIIVKETFKNDIKSIFHSDIKGVDFQTKAKEAVDDINKWCSEQTNKQIENLVSKDDIKPTTQLIVLNAVYLKAFWQRPFEARRTELQPFYVSKTETINVPTMHQCCNLRYKDLPELNAECVAKPYADPNFLFVIIKPKDIAGFKYLEQNLENIHLDYQSLETPIIGLALPKFKIETTLCFNKYLEKLKMAEMLTKEANFKGISEIPLLNPPLHVDRVWQKVFIKVDEEGTEAAAMTAPIFRGGGYSLTLKVDRPFLYRIVNLKYNLTLFSGRVVIPQC